MELHRRASFRSLFAGYQFLMSNSFQVMLVRMAPPVPGIVISSIRSTFDKLVLDVEVCGERTSLQTRSKPRFNFVSVRINQLALRKPSGPSQGIRRGGHGIRRWETSCLIHPRARGPEVYQKCTGSVNFLKFCPLPPEKKDMSDWKKDFPKKNMYKSDQTFRRFL